jgi:hypothetical protein
MKTLAHKSCVQLDKMQQTKQLYVIHFQSFPTPTHMNKHNKVTYMQNDTCYY